MTTTVKWYTDASLGAPVLNGVAGALITLLDACLVTGFGSQSVTGLVVASGVATATLGSAPNAAAGGIAVIAGATPSGLNGEQRVTAVVGNTFRFATGLSDQTATGTITTKMAGAGWDKTFTSTNLAVYRSPNVLGTRQYLRVDDTGTTSASIQAFESMSDVNTGVSKWMDNFWFKSAAANSTAVPWAIFADDRTFYLRMAAGNQDAIYPFGDFTPVRTNDPFAAVGPNGYAVAVLSSGSNDPSRVTVNAYPYASTNTPSLLLARSANFLAKSVTAYKRPEILGDHFAGLGDVSMSSGNTGLYGSYPMPYPNTSDNALVFTKFNIFETSNRNLRGALRGAFCSPQVLYGSFSQAVAVLDGQGAFSGRKIGVVTCNGGTTSNGPSQFGLANTLHYPTGRLIVDLTGPWA
nr:hypothetical protein [Rhodoferax sp.]